MSPVVVAVVALGVAVAVVAVLRARRARDRSPEATVEPECALCAAGQWHRVFITVPPGWGSLMECRADARRNGRIVCSLEEASEVRAAMGR